MRNKQLIMLTAYMHMTEMAWLVVRDGGVGYLHLEYVYLYTLANHVLKETETIISTEESTEDALYDCLGTYTHIDNFFPITRT